MAIVFNFSLDPEADKDIVQWLDEQPNRSAAIREAVRGHIAKTEGLTLADVLAEIRALPGRLRVVTAQDGPATAWIEDEPETAAANLDGLLDRLSNDDLR